MSVIQANVKLVMKMPILAFLCICEKPDIVKYAHGHRLHTNFTFEFNK